MWKAVLFDQDGVIIDTERDGHRVAFNRTFKEFGIDAEWDAELYHKLLQVGGGKERMTAYFRDLYKGPDLGDIGALVKKLHERKTDIFLEIVKDMPLRPGIHRFMQEIKAAGALIGICTTSNEKVADVVAHQRLADIDIALVIAGDMVKKKKPDPEIYTMAMEKLG
jgi:beta-phosphoglucomutase-like phosphatase (HAD superfamily)